MNDDPVWDSADDLARELADDPDWELYYDLRGRIRYLEREAGEGRLPECAVEGQCEDCFVASTTTCPISTDNDFISLLTYYSTGGSLFGQPAVRTQQSWAGPIRVKRLRTLIRVLQRHKIPMHWELVAKIVKEEEPALFPSPRSVLGTLISSPDRFSPGPPGSYFLNPG